MGTKLNSDKLARAGFLCKVKHNWWRKAPIRTEPYFDADATGYISSGTIIRVKEQTGDYIRIEVWVNVAALEILE